MKRKAGFLLDYLLLGHSRWHGQSALSSTKQHDGLAINYARNIKYTAPSKHKPAHRKSSLSGCCI